MEDIGTVLWREWRSVSRGSSRRQLLISGAMLALWAVMFPLQVGPDWVSDPVPMGLLAFALPVVIVGGIVPDSIAGERERHTLATLLASRLPDRAILVGKLGFAVALGWLSVPLVLAIALVVVNLAAGGSITSGPLLYDPLAAAAVLILALLTAVLTGAVGFFVSLRAATSQDAQQLTVIGLMMPLLVVGMALTAIGSANPDFRRALSEWIAVVGLSVIVVGAMTALAILDAALLWAADRRFRRGRLIAL